jgi:hypothetical protein
VSPHSQSYSVIKEKDLMKEFSPQLFEDLDELPSCQEVPYEHKMFFKSTKNMKNVMKMR